MGSKQPPPVLRLIRPWRLWGFLLLAMATGAFTASAVATPYFPWDLQVSRSLQALALPGLKQVSLLLHYAGETRGVVVEALALAAALLVLRQRQYALLALALLIPDAMNQVVKALIERPRPDPDLVQVLVQSDSSAFPSGHMVHFTLLFGLLLYLAARSSQRGATRGALAVLLGAILLAIGASRIYLGAHWASDVLGGLLWGLLYLWVMLYVHQRFARPPLKAARPQGPVQGKNR